MDDLMSGCNDLETAVRLQREITGILSKGGFPLRKWISNSCELLRQIPEEEREGAPVEYDTGIENNVSTLGLLWYHESDNFAFKVNHCEPVQKLTKRKILSEIAKIYDPLGFLAPITILSKIMMQEIWKERTEWDELVSDGIKGKWRKMEEQLEIIGKIRIGRWSNYEKGDRVELHGFSDASERAYAAVVYLKTLNRGKTHVSILSSKTRVAPLSNITLPKLELCAAELLVELMKKVKKAIDTRISAVRYYSDSEITLAWIKKESHNWKTFVANRVAKIRSQSDPNNWFYVNTKHNPADFASRGLYPEQLMNLSLWWNGPAYLLTDETLKPRPFDTTLEERREKVHVFMSTFEEDILCRFSTLTRAIRAIAYCKRMHTNAVGPRRGALTQDELVAAKKTIVKMTQQKFFQTELDDLAEKKQVNKKSSLITLFPFIDHDGIMRVGGRLQNSSFSYNTKHPIIIPYNGHLTKLIVDYAHKGTCHGGNQLTLALVRQEYWIPGAKRAVKKHINHCVRCHRFRADGAQQLMGNLPMARTQTMVKPFLHTGTDLAGPINLKMSRLRGTRTQKGYIVIFICLATRAIHIEVVTDLSSDAFIAAFKRLVGRRGNVATLYSDNGTNFVGASKILELDSKEAIRSYNEEVHEKLSRLSTQFKFNPAASPWMGGIWERNIGSIKYHLKRIVGSRVLTYEEMSTVLVEIEACLNSRPICTISDNPDEMEILTPGHFLVGDMLRAPVETSVLEINENRLTHWERCKRMKQEFWRIWSNEYVTQLQKRIKWNSAKENLREGDIVLVKDEITSPLLWPLGRITRVLPGKDELVRVAEVQINGKIYKRPIMKMSKLPTADVKQKSVEKEIATQEPVQARPEREADRPRRTRLGRNMIATSIIIIMACLVNQAAAADQRGLVRVYHNEVDENIWLTTAILGGHIHELVNHAGELNQGIISVYQRAREKQVIDKEERRIVVEMTVAAEQDADCYQWRFQNTTRISMDTRGAYTIEKNGCCRPQDHECRTMDARILCELRNEGKADCLINLIDTGNKTMADAMLFATKKRDDWNNMTRTTDSITITDQNESKTIRSNGSIVCKEKCILVSDSFKLRVFSSFMAAPTKTNTQRFVYLRWEAKLSMKLKSNEFIEIATELLGNHPDLVYGAATVLGIALMAITLYWRCSKLDHRKFLFNPSKAKNNAATIKDDGLEANQQVRFER